MSGNQSLKTASLALNRSRSQQTSATSFRCRRNQVRSSPAVIAARTPAGSGRLGSASIARAPTSLLRATAAARYPSQWVMLPTTPVGHCGSPAGPGGIGPGGRPRRESAAWAQARAVVYSRRRDATARRIAASSDAASSASSSPLVLTVATTPGGRICSTTLAITPGVERTAASPLTGFHLLRPADGTHPSSRSSPAPARPGRCQRPRSRPRERRQPRQSSPPDSPRGRCAR